MEPLFILLGPLTLIHNRHRRDIAAASRTIAAQKESNVYESIPTNPQGDFIVAPISDVTAHESDNQYSSVEKTADTAASPFPEFSREHQFSQLQQQQVDQHAAYAAEYYHQQQQYYAQQQQQYYQQYYQQHTAAAGQNPTAAAVYQQGSGQPTVFSAPLASQYYTSDQLHQVLYGAPPVTAGATTAPSVGVITPGHTSGVPTERQAGLPAQRTVELPAAGVGEVKGDLTENRTESLKTVGVMRTAARISRVDQWSAEDVCAWVFKNNLAGEKTCRLIREQDIDGHALLLLTNDDMENGLGLLKLGQRVKFGNAVSVLQVGVGSTSSL
ncbi:hypothetical protein BC830DRAFT_760160 [Chytriomyces sp. MP71]|nr:hypothetical protein BC830DRAFT_760160 [Chytriomyces sp. MP71]